ncbi:hypothetical protein M404DRAFT_774189 [Pisolithus tinctorius Marx 270]|uniref:Uncharacterized protein n=1 Tax=Pisolithus tinctorius Marx 270 TaxID=870435 RepID=A0A0C3N9L0_PISTI|nr:hypothetical protein M404DRAFT_774189 [Pisolithus tinctorius Marx 270]
MDAVTVVLTAVDDKDPPWSFMELLLVFKRNGAAVHQLSFLDSGEMGGRITEELRRAGG